MARFDFAFYELLFRMLGRRTGDISRVDYTPQKPAFQGLPVSQPFPRATPESQGVRSAHIMEYFRALADDSEANPHHAMVLRNGYVIGECSFAPRERNMWHITHSMCKSVTGMAIGLLVEEGKLDLDEKIGEIFREDSTTWGIRRKQHVTVRDLLRMTSGVSLSEAGAISGNNWKREYLQSATKEPAGRRFDYNSMNSYMLSAIVTKRTGETLFQYLKPRLFDPLGIDEVFWETSPEGYTKGGWGMFLKPEDAAKLGQLYLDLGRWKGQQIIPADWVIESTRKQIDNDSFGYGYQIWLDEREGSFAYNGMLGQDVIVCPDDGIILVIFAGNRELAQMGNLTDIMRGFWGKAYEPSDEPLPEDPAAYLRLENEIRHLEGRSRENPVIFRGGWGKRDRRRISGSRIGISPESFRNAVNGKTYVLEQQFVGFFPLIMQVFHNNFTDGISSVSFEAEKDALFISFREGEDDHRMQIGFESWQKTSILEHGESYLVAVKGSLKTDEKDRLTLILDIEFLEEACSRKYKFFFEKEKIELRVTEGPGDDIIMDGIAYAGDPESLKGIPFLGNVMDKGGMSLLTGAVINIIHPVVFGRVEKSSDPSIDTSEKNADLLPSTGAGETEGSEGPGTGEADPTETAGTENSAVENDTEETPVLPSDADGEEASDQQ